MLERIGKTWTNRGVLSLLDQGALSGSNFAISILFARWLSPAEYGAFAVALSCFVFLSGFQNALILEPMSVLAPKYFADNLARYLSVSLILHAVFSVTAGSLLLLVSLALNAHRPLALAFETLAFTAPFTLLFWHFRRACYLETAPHLATIGSLSYAATILVSIAIARLFGFRSVAVPFVVTGVAGTLASLTLLRLFGPLSAIDCTPSWGVVIEVWEHHWQYGKWIVGAAVCVWLANSLYSIVIGLLIGLEAAGTFRAAENFTQPLLQAVAATTILALPWLSSKVSGERTRLLQRYVATGSIVAASVGLVYILALSSLGTYLFQLVYGAHSYHSPAFLFPLLGIAVAVRAVTSVGLATAIRAAGLSKMIFLSSLVGAIATFIVGLPLVAAGGLVGAALALIVTAAAQTTTLATGYRNL